jgi:hypothetical protein
MDQRIEPQFQVGSRAFIVEANEGRVSAVTVAKRVVKFVEEPAGEVGKFITYGVDTLDKRRLERSEANVYQTADVAARVLCSRLAPLPTKRFVGELLFPKDKYPTIDSVKSALTGGPLVFRTGGNERLRIPPRRDLSQRQLIKRENLAADYSSGKAAFAQLAEQAAGDAYRYAGGRFPEHLTGYDHRTVIEWVDSKGDGGAAELGNVYWPLVDRYRVSKSVVNHGLAAGATIESLPFYRLPGDAAATERARKIEAQLNLGAQANARR